MRKAMCLVLCLVIFYAGCAGRQANPVPVYNPGDEKRTCEAIKTELTNNQADITKLKKADSDKGTWNVICFVTGFLVIVPWFLMDVKDAEKIEIEALKKRDNQLMIMASDKNCTIDAASTTKTTK